MINIDLGFVAFTLWPVVLGIGIVIGAIVSLIMALRNKGHIAKALLSGLCTAVGTYAVFSIMIKVASSHAVLPNTQFAQLDGEPVQISQISLQRPSVVHLWASSCDPCRQDMPILQQAERRFPEVAFVSLNQRESLERVEQYMRSNGIELKHVLLDSKGEIATTKGIFTLPVTLFYNASGELVYSHSGGLSEASLRQAIEQL